MLSKEKTMEILNQFSQECYNFWMKQGASHKYAFELMLKNIECIKHDPYKPCGELLDVEAKKEFIKSERGK
jgi:hypothetical protein